MTLQIGPINTINKQQVLDSCVIYLTQHIMSSDAKRTEHSIAIHFKQLFHVKVFNLSRNLAFQIARL